MHTTDIGRVLARVLPGRADGLVGEGGPVVLDSGDVGLLRSLDAPSAAEASRAGKAGHMLAASPGGDYRARSAPLTCSKTRSGGGSPFAAASAAAFS